MLLVILCCACTKVDIPPPAPVSSGGPGFPDQEVFGATTYYTKDGQRRLTVLAPHISRFDNRRLLMMDGGITVHFFDQNGVHSAVMTAKEGEMLELANRVWVRGNVIVKSDSGMVLRAEELRYDPDLGRILTDGFVTIITTQDSLAGYGFSSATDLSDWEIKRSSGATWRKTEQKKPDGDTLSDNKS